MDRDVDALFPSPTASRTFAHTHTHTHPLTHARTRTHAHSYKHTRTLTFYRDSTQVSSSVLRSSIGSEFETRFSGAFVSASRRPRRLRLRRRRASLFLFSLSRLVSVPLPSLTHRRIHTETPSHFLFALVYPDFPDVPFLSSWFRLFRSLFAGDGVF